MARRNMRDLTVIAFGAAALACSSPNQAPPPEPPPTAPYLSALSVSPAGASHASSVLVPEFSPSVRDYYVRCKAGANLLEVSMTPSSGASAALASPSSSKVEPGRALSVRVSEGQAVVAVVTAGSRTTEYWVRCLPHDFPSMIMLSHPEAGAPSPGYYLVGSSEPGQVPSAHGYAMVLTTDGVPVWYAGYAGSGISDVESLTPGTISFIPTLASRAFEVDRLAPWTTTRVAPSGEVLDPHELRALPNGDCIVLADPVTSGVDLTGVDVTSPDGSITSLGPGSNILDCLVVEFEPTTGQVVWSWVASEHFDPAADTVAPTIATVTTAAGAQIVEPFHCNSVDVEPRSGDLLVSARNMSSVFYIEKATGKVRWKMGGRASSKDGAAYVPVLDPFYQQHDARFQSWSPACGGSGQVSVFDDHSARPGPARGLLLNVVVGSGGGRAGGCDPGVRPEASVAWQYRGTGTSFVGGSFRITPDGSRIIGWGDGTSPGLVFTEMNAEGYDLLDFYFPGDLVSYRAIKMPLDAFDLGVLRRTTGR